MSHRLYSSALENYLPLAGILPRSLQFAFLIDRNFRRLGAKKNPESVNPQAGAERKIDKAQQTDKSDQNTRPVFSQKETEGGERAIAMMQRWPIRTPRPVTERLPVNRPLVTGQRVIDTLFPAARGGTVAIPG
ncbi:MAG: hypothetical protein JSU74_13020, partial [Candidatus Zixiibacteriota bacterium]